MALLQIAETTHLNNCSSTRCAAQSLQITDNESELVVKRLEAKGFSLTIAYVVCLRCDQVTSYDELRFLREPFHSDECPSMAANYTDCPMFIRDISLLALRPFGVKLKFDSGYADSVVCYQCKHSFLHWLDDDIDDGGTGLLF
ncbi:unnamed protein product [Lymnaea stagnalis]|uniref:Uncharacterized protein n=1 Tax=Lymnaea stagnalis TaxID=6523 RepID=A0AAV2HMP9_LYMST